MSHELTVVIVVQNMDSEAGRNALELGDIAHKAVDKDAAGYEVSIRPALRDVESPRYCLGQYEQLVHCQPVPDGVTAQELRKHFQSTLGFKTVKRLPHVAISLKTKKKFAFVYMDAKEVDVALQRKSFTMRSVEVRINSDKTKRTREAKEAGVKLNRRDSTSVVGKLWEAAQQWHDKHLIGLGNGTVPGFRPVDPDFALPSLENPQFDAKVAQSFNWTRKQFAQLSETLLDGGRDQIMEGLRRERAKHQGAIRDQWAASWWRRSEMDHNCKLEKWARKRNEAERNRERFTEARPEPRDWIDCVFADDWNAIKRRQNAPQFSALRY